MCELRHRVSYNITVELISCTSLFSDPNQSDLTHDMADTVDKAVLKQVEVALQNADVELQDINKKVGEQITVI